MCLIYIKLIPVLYSSLTCLMCQIRSKMILHVHFKENFTIKNIFLALGYKASPQVVAYTLAMRCL